MGNQSADRLAGGAVATDKLWLDMPGFDQRIFEDWREKECLANEGRWAARWVLRRLRRTPHDTIQRAKEIAKQAVKDFSRDIHHHRYDVQVGM